MFLLDLYKFAESYDWFDRQHIARFVYKHKECERLARAAGLTTREFASAVSKEFVSRLMGEGYLDGKNCRYWCKGSHKRPFGFELRSLEGYKNRWVYEIMNIDKLSDEELFGSSKTNRYDYDALRAKFGIS